MNEQLQQHLATIIQMGISALESSSMFIKGEIPLVIQELLMFYTIWYWGLFVLCCIGLSIIFISYKIVANKVRTLESSYDCEIWWAAWATINTLQCLFTIPGFFWYGKYALMVTFAPRLFLIHKAMEMFK